LKITVSFETFNNTREKVNGNGRDKDGKDADKKPKSEGAFVFDKVKNIFDGVAGFFRDK
jgi:hypothetical protein